MVLSEAPFNVIPPPSAVASVGVPTEPIVIFLSSTSNVVELTVVDVPVTLILPTILTTPDPLGVSVISIFVSPPVAVIDGGFPVELFAIVNSLTALAVDSSCDWPDDTRGKWKHLACVYSVNDAGASGTTGTTDGSGAQIYIDGVEQDPTGPGNFPATNALDAL